MRQLFAALCMLMASVAVGQLYDARECGNSAINWAKEQISALDPVDPLVAAQFEQLLDLY